MPKLHISTDYTVALAGNPNVGKSTVFNALTGLHQHTGNWPGKTVSGARGRFFCRGDLFELVDLPGTYSLTANSAEEEVARDYICSGEADCTVVVCDATALERTLVLALQVMTITPRVIICLNLMDEAAKKGITVDINRLQKLLGVPVVETSARSKRGLDKLTGAIREICRAQKDPTPRQIRYLPELEGAIEEVYALLSPVDAARFHAVQLLCEPITEVQNEEMCKIRFEQERLAKLGLMPIADKITACLILNVEEIVNEVVSRKKPDINSRDRKIDRILLSRRFGIPIMLLLLSMILWITVSAANIPSQWLSQCFAWLGKWITQGLTFISAPSWLIHVLMDGVYRTLTWVIAVMLPPMAIFFPLFTLLEDFGYLPRIAFNLDHAFCKAHACGKQALTMAMGLGCNAAGVTGCRIIDSPRERMIAILTNSFMPCNGRFPTLIAILTIFFSGAVIAPLQSVWTAVLLLGILIAAVGMTLLVSRLLSATVLRGMPSSFVMELPPYRRPQIGKVLIHSLFDRTLLVLWRAVCVAAPAGLILWFLANITVGESSLLTHCAAFFDPFGRMIGLDGVIVLAFLLGFPANEIVLPATLMIYSSAGMLVEYESLASLQTILSANGWSWITAVNMLILCIFHFPCSTTCLTIKKETGSWGWTVLAMFLPTGCGILLCFLFTTLMQLCGFV